MAHPMGEAKQGPLRVGCDRRLKLEFHCSHISSDVGLLSYRELDDALGLSAFTSLPIGQYRKFVDSVAPVRGRIAERPFSPRSGWSM